ncbi:peptidoglycan/LPS O-acetylase OafA/YrhL [Ochrobactrum sp. BH3]|nr:peptidoglycan/LPS O-acetylase OafA/YrhL [Ochrobactrum sp. BH3]
MQKYDGKNLEIQFLRLVAIILVALTHFPVLNTLNDPEFGLRLHRYITPWIGVDVFLVISGYLMGRILIEKTHDVSGKTEIVSQTMAFWKARFLRLFPASTFWITVMLVAGVISGNRELWAAPHELFLKWATSILAVRNIENAVHESHLGWYWSLSLENQFYIIFPIVWFLLPRKWFWPVVILLTVYASTIGIGGVHWFWFRFTGLFWGLLVYKLMADEQTRQIVKACVPSWSWYVSLPVIGGLVMLSGSANAAFEPQYLNFSASIASIVTAGILVFASLNAGFIKIPSFLKGLVYWGGELSYSFYLCHFTIWLIIQDVVRRFAIEVPSIALISIGVPISIVFSYFSYVYIERPFYRTKGIKTA